MSEMFKKIIGVLLAENVEFKIIKEDNHFIVCSPWLSNGKSIWYMRDMPVVNCPYFFSYKNNYRKFVSSRYQDYITAITDVVITCK